MSTTHHDVNIDFKTDKENEPEIVTFYISAKYGIKWVRYIIVQDIQDGRIL